MGVGFHRWKEVTNHANTKDGKALGILESVFKSHMSKSFMQINIFGQ